MLEVGMFEAKTHFSQLIEALITGRTDAISVLKHSRPVARITLIEPDRKVKFGIAKGKYRIPTWEEDKAMDAEIESLFDASAKAPLV